jgi:hypothetical protein
MSCSQLSTTILFWSADNLKILLSQRDGLGNQLFQYSAGLYFAEKYGASLEIIRTMKWKETSHGHPRPFMLNKFHITTPARERTFLDRLQRTNSRLIGLAASPIRRILGAYSHDPYCKIIGDFQPDLPLHAGIKRLYLFGHFQAYQYAQNVERKLRSELTFREPPSYSVLEMLNRTRDCKCPVSLHIRRGDYEVIHNGTFLLPMTYYDNAIAAILDIYPNATFFVFSDDVNFARTNLPKRECMVFVDHNSEEKAHEDLRLMSSCRHHIIANSTFSWWGAWLNPNAEKLVLAPDPWLPDIHRADLIPPTWRCIPTQARSNRSASQYNSPAVHVKKSMY